MIIKGDGFEYALENRLIHKLDIMIGRCEQKAPRKDACLICEGAEGEGKTNTSLAVAYYIKKRTGRTINMFFKLEPLIKFAQSTEGQIIIWDEPALDSLTTDWYSNVNKDLMRLLMTVRKKRHFFIFNFTKFHKFSEYIVVDRCLGLIHMYSRHEVESGRFVYIKKRNLERLFLGYKVSKKRLYGKLSSFRGSFPEVLERYFDKMDVTIEGVPHCTLQDYDKLKDRSIMSIGTKDKKPLDEKDMKMIIFKQMYSNLPDTSMPELCKAFGITKSTGYRWLDKEINPNSDTVDNPISHNPAILLNGEKDDLEDE